MFPLASYTLLWVLLHKVPSVGAAFELPSFNSNFSLAHLKQQTRSRFSDVFRGYRKRRVAWNGLILLSLLEQLCLEKDIVSIISSNRVLWKELSVFYVALIIQKLKQIKQIITKTDWLPQQICLHGKDLNILCVDHVYFTWLVWEMRGLPSQKQPPEVCC